MPFFGPLRLSDPAQAPQPHNRLSELLQQLTGQKQQPGAGIGGLGYMSPGTQLYGGQPASGGQNPMFSQIPLESSNAGGATESVTGALATGQGGGSASQSVPNAGQTTSQLYGGMGQFGLGTLGMMPGGGGAPMLSTGGGDMAGAQQDPGVTVPLTDVASLAQKGYTALTAPSQTGQAAQQTAQAQQGAQASPSSLAQGYTVPAGSYQEAIQHNPAVGTLSEQQYNTTYNQFGPMSPWEQQNLTVDDFKKLFPADYSTAAANKAIDVQSPLNEQMSDQPSGSGLSGVAGAAGSALGVGSGLYGMTQGDTGWSNIINTVKSGVGLYNQGSQVLGAAPSAAAGAAGSALGVAGGIYGISQGDYGQVPGTIMQGVQLADSIYSMLAPAASEATSAASEGASTGASTGALIGELGASILGVGGIWLGMGGGAALTALAQSALEDGDWRSYAAIATIFGGPVGASAWPILGSTGAPGSRPHFAQSREYAANGASQLPGVLEDITMAQTPREMENVMDEFNKTYGHAIRLQRDGRISGGYEIGAGINQAFGPILSKMIEVKTRQFDNKLNPQELATVQQWGQIAQVRKHTRDVQNTTQTLHSGYASQNLMGMSPEELGKMIASNPTETGMDPSFMGRQMGAPIQWGNQNPAPLSRENQTWADVNVTG